MCICSLYIDMYARGSMFRKHASKRYFKAAMLGTTLLVTTSQDHRMLCARRYTQDLVTVKSLAI